MDIHSAGSDLYFGSVSRNPNLRVSSNVGRPEQEGGFSCQDMCGRNEGK